MVPLSFHGVGKSFAGQQIVDGLNFSVAAGEIFGFLGANGAGKTTSIRMALDIIRPDSGRIEIFGHLPGRKHRQRMGFLPEERGLYRNMTAMDTLIYFARLKGVHEREARRRSREIIERFGLGEAADRPVQHLSKGMSQKIQLGTAIVNEPELLILDEPFSGLDPVNQEMLEVEIRHLAAAGSTIVFSTHIMQHAERLCDRLLFLAGGRSRFEGTVDQAREQVRPRIHVKTRLNPAAWPGVAQAIAGQVSPDGWCEWEVILERGSPPDRLLEHCSTQAVALRAFDVSRPTLHDVFIHFAGEENGETL